MAILPKQKLIVCIGKYKKLDLIPISKIAQKDLKIPTKVSVRVKLKTKKGYTSKTSYWSFHANSHPYSIPILIILPAKSYS